MFDDSAHVKLVRQKSIILVRESRTDQEEKICVQFLRMELVTNSVEMKKYISYIRWNS